MAMGAVLRAGLGVVLAWLAGLATFPANAQPVQLPLFRAGTVEHALIAADGGILTIGQYQFIDSTPVGRLAALRPDASINPAWAHAISGAPFRLVQDPADGSILLIGAITAVNGAPRSGIARFGADGTLLPWQASFPALPGTPTILRAAMLTGGDIVALAIDPNSGTQRLFRIDGDSGLAAPLWNVSGDVAEILALPDGSVVVAGSVSTIGGVAVSGAARLSGPDLAPTNLLDAPPLPIASLDRDPGDGRWYVASGNRVVRFEPTGQADPTWIVDADGPIDRVKVDGEARVLVAGAFSRLLGTERSRVARLRKNVPSVDAAWVPPPIRGRAGALAVNADRVVLGGSLVSAQAGQVGLVVLSRMDGTAVPPAQRRRFGIAGDEFQQRGHRAIGLPDGGAIVTGPFTHTSDMVLPGILRLNADGTLRRDWVPLIGGLAAQLTLGGDGRLYLSGLLARAGGFADNGVIRVDLATGVVDPAWRAPAGAGVEQPFALDANHAYTLQPSATPGGDRDLVRWSLAAPATQDPAWRAPARVFANIRGLQPPRPDGSLRFAVWLPRGSVGFDPPPPQPPEAMMRSTASGAAAAVDFGPRFDAYSIVERVLVDPLGRTYLSGLIQLDGLSDLVFPRLREDGTLDPDFVFRSPSVWVNGAMALHPSGDWLYASLLERLPEGWDLPRIARFDTRTGTIDPGWAPDGVAGWPLADIAMAGPKVFVVADGWPASHGLPMLRAAFLDPGTGILLRDGFEPPPAHR